MVATRRGGRVDSPSKTNQEKPTLLQATPSTGRRTRSAAKQVESRVQQTLEETCSQLSVTPATSTKKRCPGALRLHSPELPSTPVASAHEADVSDGESVCSAASTTEPPVTRSRGRSRQPRARNQENEEISEVESCSSVMSASKAGLRSSRRTRRKAAPQSSDSAPAEVGDVKPESRSSAMSQSQRVTRSQRKPPCPRSSAEQQAGDSEVSDTDSCTSSISGRVSRRKMRPIPINLDELSESSASPLTGRQTRSTGRKAAATVDVTESPSCDSEGFESGPSYSLSACRKGKTKSAGHKAVDLESDEMEVSSPVGSSCSTRSRGTPSCSRGAPASRRSARKRGGVAENTSESAEKDSSLNDSRLESTMIADDGDCTLLEEDLIQTSETCDTHLCSKDVTNISEDDRHAASVCAEEAEKESAIITKDQEEELSADDKDKDASDMETMQETVSPSERAQPCHSVTATICERASETPEEAEEKQDAAVGRSEEEEEVSRLKTDAQQVVDVREVQSEAVQVTAEQQQITAESDSEQKTKDPVVQSTKIISLLDSSDDDFSEEEESEESEEEEERRGGPSNTSAPSVEGLFMIDTRPGQDADEQYYREEEEAASRRLDQEEEDEDFVDEEGVDDDDDDEDTKILLSSRSSHLTELSSRIDPGIKVKELGGLYISFDGSKSKPVSSSLQKLKEKKNLDEVMKKSVIGADFEKKDAVPPYSESKQALKLKRRAEREKSTGNGWFNMKAPEVTQELKGDLRVLKMRGSLDPKRFYKKNDRDGFPKYFQIGTVMDNPADFYHSHIPKKDRKRTMVEELLADTEFRQKNKKRYQQIMAEKATEGAGKRRKKKKKFHKK